MESRYILGSEEVTWCRVTPASRAGHAKTTLESQLPSLREMYEKLFDLLDLHIEN